MAKEKCPICDSDVDFGGGFLCPVCNGDKRNAVADDEPQPDAGGFDLAGLDALVAAPAAPANPALVVPPVVAPAPAVAPRGGVVIDDDDDDDDEAPVSVRVAARPARPGAAPAAPAPATTPVPAVPAAAPAPAAAAAPPAGGGGGGVGAGAPAGAAAPVAAPAAPATPAAPPKPAITVTLAVTRPVKSGINGERDYWQVQAVADAADAENGGLQIFCNGQLVSCPNATGSHLCIDVTLPGKAGKVFKFTAKQTPSGVEAKPVTIKTDTVESQVKIAWFHRLCDWAEDLFEDDENPQGGQR